MVYRLDTLMYRLQTLFYVFERSLLSTNGFTILVCLGEMHMCTTSLAAAILLSARVIQVLTAELLDT